MTGRLEKMTKNNLFVCSCSIWSVRDWWVGERSHEKVSISYQGVLQLSQHQHDEQAGDQEQACADKPHQGPRLRLP